MSDYDLYYNSLLEQVEHAYKPLDLYNQTDDRFGCPKCQKRFYPKLANYADNKFEKYLVSALCTECNVELYFKLPNIKKRRVYLDQSIIGELSKVNADALNAVESTDWRLRLLAKINLAKRLQKVSFIISDVHVLETVPMPKDEHRNELWSFANKLADGNICGDMSDAFEYELYKLLDGQIPKKPHLPINCYMDTDLDSWSIRGPILMTNSWRLRLNRGWNDFRSQSRESFEITLKNQADQISSTSSVNDCIEHLKGLYLAEIFDGIKYAQIFAENITISNDWSKAYDSDPNSAAPIPIFKEYPIENGYASLIIQATLDHNDKMAQITTLQKLYQKTAAQGINAFPSTLLHATFDGEVLFRWISGLQLNPKRFNENYGMSKVMDIIHLSVFLPVVDILTVDKATFNRCQQTELKSEIEKHPCTLMQVSETQLELEHWLDKILSEPEDEDFKATRRLFFGMNLEEEQKDAEKLSAEIMDRVYAILHSKSSV